MSRWLGTREDQVVASGLASDIARLFCAGAALMASEREAFATESTSAAHSLATKVAPTGLCASRDSQQTDGWVAHIEAVG